MFRFILSPILMLLPLNIFATEPLSPLVTDQPIDIYTARQAIGERPPTGLEGVWMLTDDESTIIIVRESPMTYSILSGRSSNLALPPGLKIGTIRMGGKQHLYDVSLARKINNRGQPSGNTNVALRVDESNDRFYFLPYKHGVSLDLYRLIPYMFRFTIKRQDTRPEGINGAHRLWPAPRPSFDNPVAL